MCKQTGQKRKKEKRKKKKNMVLTSYGKLVPVCSIDRAKVDYSVFCGFAKVWGRLILTQNRYISPTCTGFLSGSRGWGLRSCVLATSCASGEKYFVVGKER